jgi:MoaA/NifB/PqqE/SkfB family radical SAM enzyme
MYQDGIESLHLELSSFCNASCLGCARTSDMGSGIESPLRPSHLSLETVAQVLGDPAFANLKKFFLCGVMGDPLASPYLVDILKLVKRKYPLAFCLIHTNGAIGSQTIWEALALLSGDQSIEVVFSIDGLEDSHHHYRVGLSFPSIMKNARAFISNGGNATWKWIQFETNAHQIEEARARANEMGFKQFVVRKPYDDNRVPGKITLEQVQNSKSQSAPFQHWTDDAIRELVREQNLLFSAREVSCQAKKDKEIYIDAQGKVWPCCWIGNLGLHRRSFPDREHFHRFILSHYAENFNDTKTRKVSEILDESWFRQDLEVSWAEKTVECSTACKKHCGR